jgi:hypothetical protein
VAIGVGDGGALALPAPDTPDFASIMIEAVSTTPRFTSGARPRIDAVG